MTYQQLQIKKKGSEVTKFMLFNGYNKYKAAVNFIKKTKYFNIIWTPNAKA